MKITKVRLLGSRGLKGIEIKYRLENEVNHRTFNNGHTEECKHPIHLDLENAFNDLRFFLLEIYGVVKYGQEPDEVQEEINNTIIHSVNIGDGTFIIKGERMATPTAKYIAMETPEMDTEDEYENFNNVMSIIEVIKKESELHMKGKKKVTDREYMVRWVQANEPEGVTMDTIKGMSEDELKEWATKILEKQGSIVLHSEDIADENELDLNELNQEPILIEAKK